MRVAQQLQLLFLLQVGMYANAEWLQMQMLARTLSSDLEQGMQHINAKIRTMLAQTLTRQQPKAR